MVLQLRVKLTKEGRKSYYGTEKCVGGLDASTCDGLVSIEGAVLLEAGACEKLIDHREIYLFEENEVEFV